MKQFTYQISFINFNSLALMPDLSANSVAYVGCRQMISPTLLLIVKIGLIACHIGIVSLIDSLCLGNDGHLSNLSFLLNRHRFSLQVLDLVVN